MSAANIASLVFLVFSLIATAAIEYLTRAFAQEAGVNRWVFAMVPALIAMLYALFVYQNAERKIRRLGESVSRGAPVIPLTWLSFSALMSWIWCAPREFGACLRNAVIAALAAGLVVGIIVIPPRPRA